MANLDNGSKKESLNIPEEGLDMLSISNDLPLNAGFLGILTNDELIRELSKTSAIRSCPEFFISNANNEQYTNTMGHEIFDREEYLKITNKLFKNNESQEEDIDLYIESVLVNVEERELIKLMLVIDRDFMNIAFEDGSNKNALLYEALLSVGNYLDIKGEMNSENIEKYNAKFSVVMSEAGVTYSDIVQAYNIGNIYQQRLDAENLVNNIDDGLVRGAEEVESLVDYVLEVNKNR